LPRFFDDDADEDDDDDRFEALDFGCFAPRFGPARFPLCVLDLFFDADLPFFVVCCRPLAMFDY
jgi:hypothetical protein